MSMLTADLQIQKLKKVCNDFESYFKVYVKQFQNLVNSSTPNNPIATLKKFCEKFSVVPGTKY